MDDDDDLDAYMRTLVNRNDGSLNVGAAYSDVQNRFKDEVDWRNQSGMKDYLESRGWTMETAGGVNYAKPPEEN